MQKRIEQTYFLEKKLKIDPCLLFAADLGGDFFLVILVGDLTLIFCWTGGSFSLDAIAVGVTSISSSEQVYSSISLTLSMCVKQV